MKTDYDLFFSMIASFFAVSIEKIKNEQTGKVSISHIVSVKSSPDGEVKIFDGSKYFGVGEKARNRFRHVMNTPNITFQTSEP